MATAAHGSASCCSASSCSPPLPASGTPHSRAKPSAPTVAKRILCGCAATAWRRATASAHAPAATGSQSPPRAARASPTPAFAASTPHSCAGWRARRRVCGRCSGSAAALAPAPAVAAGTGSSSSSDRAVATSSRLWPSAPGSASGSSQQRERTAGRPSPPLTVSGRPSGSSSVCSAAPSSTRRSRTAFASHSTRVSSSPARECVGLRPHTPRAAASHARLAQITLCTGLPPRCKRAAAMPLGCRAAASRAAVLAGGVPPEAKPPSAR